MDIFPSNDVHLAEKMNKKKLIDFQRKRKWSGTFEMRNCNSGCFQTKKKKNKHIAMLFMLDFVLVSTIELP